MSDADAGDYVGRCHALAGLLEVSAFPKPGNVHRLRDSAETRYEHFLAGSVATTPSMRDLANRAGKMKSLGELGLGGSILRATKDMMAWQRGGNVQLGVILLHAPIAAAAGAVYRGGDVSAEAIREELGEIIASAGPRDTVNIYKAIDLAMTRRVLGEVDELDVSDESSWDVILSDGLTPLDVFELCRDRDSVCGEWVTGFEVTFTEGYPYLSRRLSDGKPPNTAIVETFLHTLSGHPDSLILRKSGRAEAERVSGLASETLEHRDEPEFMDMVWRMDDELWSGAGALNPGTTADLTAASIFVQLLTGWRP